MPQASPPGSEGIRVCAVEEGSAWYAIAHAGVELVATSVGRSREEALRDVQRSLPAGCPREVTAEPSAFAAETLRMLAALEAGHEEGKRFLLASAYVPEPLYGVLLAAASIPLGYVSTYGSIAEVAGTEARVVGQAMATNPLYPIVPCHRVVGSDLSLTGYGRRQDRQALRAKLGRLRAESRGFADETVAPASSLRLYPVEWAIAKAVRDGVDDPPQPTLFG